MDDQERLPVPEADNEPQIFKPEKVGGKWKFSRKDFLKLAIAAAAGAMASHIPGVKDLLGRRVQLIAHATELTESNLKPGQLLTKVWYLKNNSELPWGDGAVLNLGGATTWQTSSSISLPNLAPGEVTTVQVSMVVPESLDPRPFEAAIKVADEDFALYLPVIHKPSEEPPCSCDSYIPCTCESESPCGCVGYVPCTCHYYYCTCDYEIPCVCDYLPPCVCDYLPPCVCDVHVCPCDYLPPCTCDTYVPCSCVAYVPCGCVYYFP